MLSLVTSVLAGPLIRPSALAASTWSQTCEPDSYGNCASILSVVTSPNFSSFFRSSWSVCSLSWKIDLLRSGRC